MRKLGLGVAAWLLLGLETGLRGTLQLWSPLTAPSLVLILAAFIAMCAPSRLAAWWAVGLGILIDLTTPLPMTSASTPAVILGPHALAYLLASHLILSMRGVMIRRNPLTLGFLTLTGGLVAQATLLAMLWVRSWFDGIAFNAMAQLGERAAGAAYSAVVAVALAFVLLPAAEFLGLPSQTRARFGGHARA
ncbi:MAG: hypothetical protein HBSAPP03_17490 [Phycisphaerae bacterium]|nr:MAG: hypothetical protein HBSAPP03_17490 [Phycisphaerae bacterium]